MYRSRMRGRENGYILRRDRYQAFKREAFINGLGVTRGIMRGWEGTTRFEGILLEPKPF